MQPRHPARPVPYAFTVREVEQQPPSLPPSLYLPPVPQPRREQDRHKHRSRGAGPLVSLVLFFVFWMAAACFFLFLYMDRYMM
ncbi:MAG: hypothetical protein AAF730_01815 [Bacteroidota bacterium]